MRRDASLKSAIRMLVALVAIAAQAGAVGAGVLDAQKGASAASHFEAGGTNLHYAHSEATCYICRAQHSGDAVTSNAPVASELSPGSVAIAARELDMPAIAPPSARHSRAPPANV